MSQPYRSGPPRPLLWVPDVLRVETPWAGSAAKIRVAPLATSWDGHEDVTQWKTIEHYVVVADTPELLQPAQLAPASCPRVRALFESATIRRTGPSFDDARARRIAVGFARGADDHLHVAVDRRDEPLASIGGALAEIEAALLPPEVAADPHAREAALDALDREDLVDRILRAATFGLVDGRTIALAHVIDAVERLPEGARRAMLDALEAELAEIEARANETRVEARAIARAIAEAGDEDEIAIPVYGRARRVRRERLVLRGAPEAEDRPLAARVMIAREDGTVSHELELPAEDEWLVDDVEPWEPPSRAPRVAVERGELRAAVARRRAASGAFLVVVLALSIGFVVLVALVLVRAR